MERGCPERIPGHFRTAAGLSLPETAALLASARAWLGNDSGPSHLAALCGTPSTVLFGPTDPRVWRPLGERVRVIISPDGSMEGIGVREVLEALKTV
jgi:heptosyltransferase III